MNDKAINKPAAPEIANVCLWNQILRKGSVESVSAELSLPCDKALIEQTLRDIGVDGAGENGWMKVQWVDPYGHEISLAGYERRLNYIYEFNHLAEKIAALDNVDLARFQALCGRYLDKGSAHPEENFMFETTFANAINMTHNISENIGVIPGVGRNMELGHYCVSKQLITGFENANEAILRYLDYEKIGSEYRDLVGGAFYNGCLVYGLPEYEELKLPYDGRSLLIEPEPEQGQTIGITMGGM